MVKNLYERHAADEVRERIGQLRATNQAQWGRMNAPQMLAHCSAAMEMALGENNPPKRMLLGYIFGGVAKRSLLYKGEPMRRNSPTTDSLRMTDTRDFATERQRLVGLIDRFTHGGPARCTTHPHTFFGPMTPVEWATLMYAHLDHHLKQFGA